MLVHQLPVKSRRLLLSRLGIWIALLVLGFATGIGLQMTFGFFVSSRDVSTTDDSLPVGGPEPVVASLATWKIRLAEKDLQDFLVERKRIRRTGETNRADSSSYPALLLADGVERTVTLRLTADWLDQLRARPALDVSVDDGGVRGMTRFTLHLPEANTWDNPWLRQRHLRQEGIVGTNVCYVDLALNGETPRLMQVREVLSDATLTRENGERLELVDLSLIGASSGDAPVAVLDDVAAGSAAARVLDALHGRSTPSDVFDVRKLAGFLAVTELWSVGHALEPNRMRFAVDSRTGRIEPVAMHSLCSVSVDNRVYAAQPGWIRRLLADPTFAAAYVEQLERVADRGETARLRDRLRQEWRSVPARLKSEAPDFRPRTWQNLEQRGLTLRTLLEIPDLVHGHYWWEPADGPSLRLAERRSARFSLVNAMKLPVEVVGVRVNGRLAVIPGVGDRPTLVYPRDVDPPDGSAPHRLERTVSVDIDDDAGEGESESETVEAICRLWGSDRWQAVPLAPWSARAPRETGLPEFVTAREFTRLHRFSNADAIERVLTVRPGDWNVDGDLIVPEGWTLRCGPGTTLRFRRGRVLLARSSVELRGTESEPVRLTGARGEWAGVAVLNAADRSIWEHVVIDGTRGVERPGWILTGGVTFFRSGVEFSDCVFRGHRGEDAVNVVAARFRFAGCRFRDTVSDAFDGDFVTGELDRCGFERIGGDAIDVSGSDVRVSQIDVRDVADKGVSAGERSRVVGDRLDIVGAKIAVCSKDMSRVTVGRLTVRDASYALAAYTKKPEFGPAELTVEGIQTLRTTNMHLSQLGSRITVDGRRMPTGRVDVEQLYREPETVSDVAQRN